MSKLRTRLTGIMQAIEVAEPSADINLEQEEEFTVRTFAFH